jgi:16S rRNA (guanine527-N7)-methyltransferase
VDSSGASKVVIAISVRERIVAGSRLLSCPLGPHQLDALTAFLLLLRRWNRVYNLTAVRDPAEMVPRHILDSLAVAPYLRPPRIIDVGSGAGLPGIPLAIACPDLAVVLLDSNAKRTRFLNQAKAELALDNVVVARARVQSYRCEQGYATVISRAFASPGRFAALAGHLLAPEGRLLAMQGQWKPEQGEPLPAGYRVEEVHQIPVPGLRAQRHLLQIAQDQQH